MTVMPELQEKVRVPAGLDPALMLTEVEDIGRQDLAPMVREIDADGVYPEGVLRAFGKAGAFSRHLPDAEGGVPDLASSIEAMSRAGTHCLSTAFCMWCQDALGWYIFNSDNDFLKETLGPGVAAGEALGGTGLSNPMKSLFGIERLKLKGKRVEGGYVVKGALPWVSNLGPDHWLAFVFELPEGEGGRVMAVANCSAEGLKLTQNEHFVALEGTRTFGLQFRDVFIPDEQVLADPIDDYITRIRAGFILLQAGMAIGMVRSCIDLMEQVRPTLGHVNMHLPDQPEHFREQLETLDAKALQLCQTPYDTSRDYFVEVIRTRLAYGDLSVQAAHNAMLHCGARGYVLNGAAQRKLREAYFVAIVTPATKQLRKMLADFGAA